MVDFVLVSLVLVPLVVGIIHVGLVLHVRNTLTSAAAEGARHGALADRTPADGSARTRTLIRDGLAGRYADDVTAGYANTGGLPVVEVRVRARIPTLGLWGPAVDLAVVGHGVVETLP